MDNHRGICSFCAYDKHCAFPRKFPVWQCEEYNNDNAGRRFARKPSAKSKKTETKGI